MSHQETTWSVLSIIVTAITILVASIAVFVWWRFSYWRRRGISYIPPVFPLGNTKDALLGRRPFAHVMHDIYQKLAGQPFAGVFMALQPSLLLIEPQIIRDVMIRYSQSNFQHHVAHPDLKSDPILAKNLFMLRGKRWREMRSSLSPAFSPGKMKMMYPLLVAKGQQLADKMEATASKPNARADMKLNFSRFTTDVIASCAFGIETNSLTDPDNEFLRVGLKIFERTARHVLDTLIIFQFPSLIKLTGSVFIVKEVADFFRHLVWSVVKEREEKGIKRGDYLDLLIQLKNKGRVQTDGEETGDVHQQEKERSELLKCFNGDDLVAQAVVFYFAGYETSSTASNFALFELAANPECQEKLCEEIDSTLKANGGTITYETLHGMRYLDMVVNETLRKYPSVAVLDRVCTEEYRQPDFNLVVPKGMHVLIPAYSIHRNPIYYPDPEKFDPERFTEEGKKNRPNYCYMPFGEGPRNCIGMRFGLMQVKVGLVSILSRFQFSLPEELKGLRSPPLDNMSLLVAAEDGLTLIVSKRDQLPSA